jgi:hypothetical protein
MFVGPRLFNGEKPPFVDGFLPSKPPVREAKFAGQGEGPSESLRRRIGIPYGTLPIKQP